MPELPEVETVVRDLRGGLEGATVIAAWVGQPGVLRHPETDEFVAGLRGRAIRRLYRHGKFILADLSGKPAEVLVLHLGMSGRLWLSDPAADLPPHTHLRLGLSSGLELRMQDPRRFGRVLLGAREQMVNAGLLPRLGPEPFDGGLTPIEFDRLLAGRRRAVKALLLDQRVVAGLGNIYADEALFRAGVRPAAIAARLGRGRRRRLYAAIHDALAAAVDLRGTTFSTYRDGLGQPGGNQHALQVYGRAGSPCLRCDRPLTGATIAGRTTVFCRRCQR